MMHSDHGWPKSSLEDENNNRYQPNAPLVVWCGRCRTILPADDEWARRAAAADGRADTERILLTKIERWAGREVRVTGVGRDFRGRIELEFTDVVDGAP